MSEEQVGTAPAVTPSAPESAPTGAEPTVQPPVAAKVETAEPKPATPNWDDTQNPYRQRFDGLQGNFKQLKTQHDQMAEQVRRYEQDRQSWESERQRLATEAEQRKLDELLSQDDGPVAQEVKKARERQKLQETLQQQIEPQIHQRAMQQAHSTIYSQYTTGLTRALEAFGLSGEDVQKLAAEKPSFDAFVEAALARAVQNKVGDIDTLVQKKVSEATAATKTQLLAEQRGKEPSPDTGSGDVADNDTAFMTLYAAGKSNDHKRARQLLGR